MTPKRQISNHFDQLMKAKLYEERGIKSIREIYPAMHRDGPIDEFLNKRLQGKARRRSENITNLMFDWMGKYA